MTSDEELSAVFREEVSEQIENLLQALQQHPDKWDVQLLFRWAHSIKGAARMVDAAELRDAAHMLEELFSALREGMEITEPIIQAARQACSVLEAIFLVIDESHADAIASLETAIYGALGQAVPAQAPAGTVGDEDSQTDAPTAERAADVDGSTPATAPKSEASSDGTIRISNRKLDRLMEFSSDLIGAGYQMDDRIDQVTEIAITLEGLTRSDHVDASHLRQVLQSAQILKRNLIRDRGQYEQTSVQVRDSVRSLRMVSVDSLRTLLTRAVRDAAKEEKKLARFSIEGGDCEIDRAILDELRDPMLHLLRNAVAHGIETPKARKKAGKPEQGEIVLSAGLRGGWARIEVRDDGAGLNWDKIRNKAVTSGYLSDAGNEITQAQLTEVLFSAGFSTAQKVSSVAGRGVGLDVVRENLKKFGGSVMVTSGEGGTTFAIEVPMTRLTTRGVFTKMGSHYLTFPVTSVERTIVVERAKLRSIDGKTAYVLNGEPLPIVELSAFLGLPGESAEVQPAVVVTDGTRRCVCLIDEVLGEKEFLMQQLSWNLKHVNGVAGGSVIDGGAVSLVIDTPALLGGSQTLRQTNKSSQAQHKQTRILVVDDSITTRTLEKNILGAAGYHVTLCVDGADAWDRLQVESFSLVISDVEMPKMDGLELARSIRADERFDNLPIILVTSLGNEEHKQAGADAGADAYIVKGEFDQDQLLAAVRRLL